jgi:CspA family cold shock protein
MEGTVKRWVTSYGFIGAEEMDKDVFVHESSVKSGGPLKVGQKVKFDVEEGDKGTKAVNVEVIEEAGDTE